MVPDLLRTCTSISKTKLTAHRPFSVGGIFLCLHWLPHFPCYNGDCWPWRGLEYFKKYMKGIIEMQVCPTLCLLYIISTLCWLMPAGNDWFPSFLLIFFICYVVKLCQCNAWSWDRHPVFQPISCGRMPSAELQVDQGHRWNSICLRIQLCLLFFFVFPFQGSYVFIYDGTILCTLVTSQGASSVHQWHYSAAFSGRVSLQRDRYTSTVSILSVFASCNEQSSQEMHKTSCMLLQSSSSQLGMCQRSQGRCGFNAIEVYYWGRRTFTRS